MHLIACPKCSRQFDVTSLPPDSRVRCACDEILAVGFRGPLAVSALHCRHCGGIVKVEEDTCLYCSAALSERDRMRTTLCPVCYARLDDDSSHCKKCGVEIRPQALTPLPEDHTCPRCEAELGIRFVGSSDVVECTRCGGLWLDPARFERICLEAERSPKMKFHVTSTATDVDPFKNRAGYIPCVRCGELMLHRQFRRADRSSGVVLDFCKNHGVWLDPFELEKIVAFVQVAGHEFAASSAPSGPEVEAAFCELRHKESAARSGLTQGGGLFTGLIDFLTAIFASNVY